MLSNKDSVTTAIADIRRLHPFLRKLTTQGAGMLFKQGKIIKLKPCQILYKEGSKDNSVFIIIYGKMILRSIEKGVLGTISSEESIGEESFLKSGYKFRYRLFLNFSQSSSADNIQRGCFKPGTETTLTKNMSIMYVKMQHCWHDQ